MTYKTEFPDFRPEDMPAIPFGFDDVSWHNDACPRFENEGMGLTLWVNYIDPEQREVKGMPRFILCGDDEIMEETESMADILAAIDRHCVSNLGGHTDTGRGVCAHCAKLL